MLSSWASRHRTAIAVALGGVAAAVGIYAVARLLRAIGDTSSSSSSGPIRADADPRETVVILVDNGSLRAASFLSLRRMAEYIEQKGRARFPNLRVIPASARISDRIPEADMGPHGGKAEVLEGCLLRLAGGAAGGSGKGVEEGRVRHVIILPAFLGPSETITDFVPSVFAKVNSKLKGEGGGGGMWGGRGGGKITSGGAAKGEQGGALQLTFTVARPVIDVEEQRRHARELTIWRSTNGGGLNPPPSSSPPPHGPDLRVARVIADHVKQVIREKNLSRPLVAVCDHGSPSKAVTEVRDLVAHQVERLLTLHLGDADGDGEDVASCVAPCSMERREGEEYDYNEPTLEHLLQGWRGMRVVEGEEERQHLQQQTLHEGGGLSTAAAAVAANEHARSFAQHLGRKGETIDVVVAMMFISPGKHAGEGGDVATILKNAEISARREENGSLTLRTHMTPLLGGAEGFLSVLMDRLGEVYPVEKGDESHGGKGSAIAERAASDGAASLRADSDGVEGSGGGAGGSASLRVV